MHGNEQIMVGDSDCGILVGYVDDGAYIYAQADPAVLSTVLSRKYILLENWMNCNKLVINQDKTHIMVMGTKKSAPRRSEVCIESGNFRVYPTETEKTTWWPTASVPSMEPAHQ